MKENFISKTLSLAVILGAILLTAFFLVSNMRPAFGEVTAGDQTEATTTPQLADRTNLCVNPTNLTSYASSTQTGTLDFIYISAPLTSDLLLLDATTTNAAMRLPTATSSNILLWLPAGTGTSTIKTGIQFKRGLIVDYGAGVASTTIGYRCGY